MRKLLAVVLLALALGACGKASDEAGDPRVDPVSVTRDAKTHEAVVRLTSTAARRLDIHRAVVGADRIVPYAAVLYTADGRTWVFTEHSPLRFVRTAVVVQDIRGDTVVLRNGPPAGTRVVTTGAAELLGAESGVGEV